MNSNSGNSTTRAARTATVLRSSAASGIIVAAFAFALLETGSAVQEPSAAVAPTLEREPQGSPRGVELRVAAAEDDEFSLGPHYSGEPGGY